MLWKTIKGISSSMPSTANNLGYLNGEIPKSCRHLTEDSKQSF